MNVALIQMSCGIDRRENIQKAVKLVHEAADNGGSFISNPYGDVLARGDNESDQVVEAEIHLEQIQAFRNMIRFNRDRRPETHRELLKVVTG
jgi:predicted amidohydrolase